MIDWKNRKRFLNMHNKMAFMSRSIQGMQVNQTWIKDRMEDPEQFEKDLIDLRECCEKSKEIIGYILEDKKIVPEDEGRKEKRLIIKK